MMISWNDIYEVVAVLVPLYMAMLLAYGSVRWWNIFNPTQCAGINRFVAVFAIPVLSFHLIASDNLYATNLIFIAADTLQKVAVLAALFLWQYLSKHGSLEWTITLFSLSTLPNTLIVGIPLLTAMYGNFSGELMVQIVKLQSIVWYTLLIFLYEFREASALVADHEHAQPAADNSLPQTSDADVEANQLHASTEATEQGGGGGLRRNLPPHRLTPVLMLSMVCKKLFQNPNTYASIIGVLWSLVAFRWNIQMPKMVQGCITLISNTGLGMAMFSLGLFMALEPKMLSCGKSIALIAMVARFLVGPAVSAGASLTLGIRGDLLRIAIIQAALPQGIVSFVFAKEYNCHANIISTAIIVGMLLALPVTILYYVLLQFYSG